MGVVAGHDERSNCDEPCTTVESDPAGATPIEM
jgi:hypothetical protein